MRNTRHAAHAAAALLLAPAAALAQGQCAVTPAAAQGPAAPPPGMVAVPAPQNPPAPPLPRVPAADVARMPALATIQAAGAVLYDLPPRPELGGLRPVFAVSGQNFQVFYVVPPGSVAIRGIAQGPDGGNITLAQTADIPGVRPEVEIRSGAALVDGSVLKTAAAANHGLWGADGAPLVYMFVDPLCSFSVRAAQALKPYVERGQVQVAVVPVAILDHETQGRSTPAASALLSPRPEGKDIAGLWLENVRSWAGGVFEADYDRRPLQANMRVAEAIGLQATPTFVWTKADGGEARFTGLPSDVAGFVAGLGAGPARGR